MADPFLKELAELSESDASSDQSQDDDDAADFAEPAPNASAASEQDYVYSKLLSDGALKSLLTQIDTLNVEDQMAAVKSTNEYLKRIAPEMQIVFKRCRDLYKFFPDLETIINTPYEYARVVLAMGQSMDFAAVQDLAWLPNKSKLSLTVAASHLGESETLSQ